MSLLHVKNELGSLLPDELYEVILQFASSKTRALLCTVSKLFSIICPKISKSLSAHSKLYDKNQYNDMELYTILTCKECHLFVKCQLWVQCFIDNWDIYFLSDKHQICVQTLLSVITYTKSQKININYHYCFGIACRKRNTQIMKALCNKVQYCYECCQPIKEHLKMKDEFEKKMNESYSVKRFGWYDC